MRPIRGFTLIELLVVLAIVALLLSIVAPRMMNQIDSAEETALRQNLASIRLAIDKHFADKGEYPESLGALVEARYLRAIPSDPVTGRNDTWVLVTITDGGKTRVYDIHSGAEGKARNLSDYVSW